MNQVPATATTDSRAPEEEGEALYRKYAPQGVRYARAILKNGHDAEEVVQDAFVKLYRNGESNPNLPGRFFTTVRNLCIDLLRRRKRKATLSLDEVNEPKSQQFVVNRQQQAEAHVQAEIEKLPETWQNALMLKLQKNMKYADIAKEMNVTHAQVRTWIFRARQALRKQLLESNQENENE